MGTVAQFMERHFRHFNARETLDAARGWRRLLDQGGKMFLAMAGAMSTAELGVSLAEMIRRDKIHAVCCTAANLEEDIYNLVAHEHYRRVPHYRDLTPEEETELFRQGYNRVTDTCIPENEAFRRIEAVMLPLVQQAEAQGRRHFPYEYFYQMIRSGGLEPFYQIDPRDSWVVAASQKNLPIFTPGFEDSTTGNVVVSWVYEKKLKGYSAWKNGFEQMELLAQWYLENSREHPIGFFQIGGGIAGDFAICAVPLLIQDMRIKVPYWSYFCQISDSTTSYGSYSGAVPNEKITWGKLDTNSQRYMINSDASLVAPLVFAYVLDW